MGRPKKADTKEMLKIVNMFFEENGNPAMLKCSTLEKYAQSMGFNIKAYDFRRCIEVRQRIDELTKSVSIYSAGSVAFKNMDIDAFLKNNTSIEKLRRALIELNAYWKSIYENSLAIAKKNKSLMSELHRRKKENSLVSEELTSVKNELRHTIATKNKLILENNYLKRMIREKLYPSVANQILKNEFEVDEIETNVTEQAMEHLIESNNPITFSEAVKEDRTLQTESEKLLERMRLQMKDDV